MRKKMSKTHCTFVEKGMFVSHRGASLCCIHPDKQLIKPSDFWSGETRKTALDNMKNDQKVDGCDICYYRESNNNSSSRTLYKSYQNLPTKSLPTMLDLDFSNFCNLKCVMCNSGRSSNWAKDEGKDVSKIAKDIIDNLYSVSQDVQQITIQGGEPSIMEEYEYYFELLAKGDISKNIDLMVITNATNLNQKFYKLLGQFKSVRLSVSVDAFGSANDYIRWPSKFTQIEKNLTQMASLESSIKVELYFSLNILSMFNFDQFLNWAKKIETIYKTKNKHFGVIPAKVDRPKHYSPFIAPVKLKDKFITDVQNFLKDQNLTGNSNFKTEMIMLSKRIQKSPTDNTHLKNLKQKISGLDKDRKVNITNYIPKFFEYIN